MHLCGQSQCLRQRSGYGLTASRSGLRYKPGCVTAARATTDDDVPQVGWLWDSKAKNTRDKLAAIKARPKKALGQNFVTDDAVLQSITAASGVGAGDMVLEIGPGTGNLTKYLLEAGATVLAVEKDYALAEKLEEVLQGQPQFHIVQGDALRVNVVQLIHQLRELHAKVTGADPADLATRKVKVVANLPYYITTDILKQLLPTGQDVSHLAFMLQDEVAQRLSMDKPSGTQYRPMTVIANYFSVPSYKLKIDRRCYFPSPQVDGALVVFALREPGHRPAVQNEREFLSFVRQAFSSKRKMLANSLQPKWSREDVTAAVQAMGLSASVRPQDLSSAQYVECYNTICKLEASHDTVTSADVNL